MAAGYSLRNTRPGTCVQLEEQLQAGGNCRPMASAAALRSVRGAPWHSREVQQERLGRRKPVLKEARLEDSGRMHGVQAKLNRVLREWLILVLDQHMATAQPDDDRLPDQSTFCVEVLVPVANKAELVDGTA